MTNVFKILKEISDGVPLAVGKDRLVETIMGSP